VRRKTVSGIMLTLLLAIMTTTPFARTQFGLEDWIFVSPELSKLYVGEHLLVSVEFGYGFEPGHAPIIEFSLRWNASILEFLDWGGFWDSLMVDFGDDYVSFRVDNPSYPSTTTLLWIDFKAKAVGSTILDLYDSNVYTSDGYVDILPRPPLPLAIHNVDTGLNYTTIQEAIDAPETLDGHTILVDAGTYFEHVVVKKPISLIGENKHKTIIDGNGTGTIVNVVANSVNISGFTLRNSGSNYPNSGIRAYSSGNNISYNIIRKNCYGISLSHSNNNIITGNIASNNAYYGVCLFLSSNNTVSGTNITNNSHGILLDYFSNYNSIIGTNITNNYNGVHFLYSSNSVISGNTITANNWDGILLECSSNYNRILGNTISANNWDGIELYDSSNSVISGNDITTNNQYGINLHYHSNHNSISRNNVVNNNVGVYLGYWLNHNSVSGNNIVNNRNGVYLYYYSNYNSVSGNNIVNNDKGILLNGFSNYNDISGNNITANRDKGIQLRWSSNYNNIYGNTIRNNGYGIHLSGTGGSSNNFIYHNNYVNNTSQVYTEYSVNVWDDGYPSGGNYWSDHTGVDVKSGPNQDQPSSDGIGDTPYVIDENNQDNYPFMDPNGWLLHQLTQLTVTSSPVIGITFTIDGIPETTPYTRWLFEGSYTLEMPQTHDGYEWSHWQEDGDTNRTKTVTVDTNTTLTGVFTPVPPIATVDIDPDTLNLKSKGKWITCYIELPKGYDVSDIDRTTILLNGTIPVASFWVDKPLESVVGDHDDDGIPDLMVKFSRTEVSEYIHYVKGITYGDVTLTITGELYDGSLFEGSDVIRIKMLGEVNSDDDDDEYVDIYDIAIPEFPSFLILPLFMIATLLAVIVYRRKHST